MKKLIIISLFAGIFLSGCITAKKFKTIVNDRTTITVKSDSSSYSDNFIKIKVSDAILTQFSETQVKKTGSYFVPAILYWGWNHAFICNMQSDFAVNNFTKTIKAKAHEYNAKQIFQDKTLEIEIEKLPLQFIYRDYGHIIYYIYGYSYIYNEYIKMLDNSEMIVKYSIIKNNEIQKTDSLKINFNTAASNPAYSTKKLINTFIDNLTTDCNHVSGWILERIIDDL